MPMAVRATGFIRTSGLGMARRAEPIHRALGDDGFRMMVRRDPGGVRLLTRHGNDWTGRFPLIAVAAGALRVRSFLIDGEAVARGQDGMPSFDRPPPPRASPPAPPDSCGGARQVASGSTEDCDDAEAEASSTQAASATTT
jgi:hypothetical protein